MLNIKLPKGKVARALVRCADIYLAHAKVQDQEHLRNLEVWRKHMHLGYHSAPPRTQGPDYMKEAKKFQDMANCCTFSTGDVYVSAELWEEIKGLYNA